MLNWWVDQVLLFTCIVVRAHFIFILSAWHVHSLFVNAFEKDDSQQASNVGENEENPNMICLVDIALEEDGPKETHRSGRVVWWAGHDVTGLTVADNGDVCRGNDQSSDGWIFRHLCVLLSLSQIQEGDKHGTDHLQDHRLDEKRIVLLVFPDCQRPAAVGLENIVAQDGSKQCSSVLGRNIKKTEKARKFSCVASEHECKRDSRVEVGAWNTRAKNQQHEETAKKANKAATLSLECRVEKRSEEQCAEELKDKNQERLFECGHAVVRMMRRLHLSFS